MGQAIPGLPGQCRNSVKFSLSVTKSQVISMHILLHVRSVISHAHM